MKMSAECLAPGKKINSILGVISAEINQPISEWFNINLF